MPDIAPGMTREFTADCWGEGRAERRCGTTRYDEAEDMIRRDVQMNIQGYDLDPEDREVCDGECEGSRRRRLYPFSGA